MLRLRILSAVAVGAALAAAPLAAQQPSPPERELGTTSAQARAEFVSGLSDVYNIFPSRAVEHFESALKLEPHYALAEALHAVNAPGLTDDQRQEELNVALTDAAHGSTSEVLDILSYRADKPAERRAVLQALVALEPDDPGYAYRLANTETDPAGQIAAMRQVAARFSDFAPAHNVLAYLLYQGGDHDAGLSEVREYVRLAPDHPNAHDSYGELLAWNGDLEGALKQYQAATSLAPDFAEAYAGEAEVQHLMGRNAEARAAWQQAIQHGPADARADYLTGIAGSYLSEGNTKMAVQTLGEALAASENTSQKVEAHLYSAMAEANAGHRDAARAHAAEAREAGKDWPGMAPYDVLLDIYTGDLDAARSGAAKVAADAKTANARDGSHLLGAIVAAVSGDVATAQSEVAQVHVYPALLGKAFIAQAQSRAGNKAEARALRDEILKSTQSGFLDDLARAQVKKL